MKKMKRAIKRVMFYLVCGFVMTWLVAWALAFTPHYFRFGFHSFRSLASFSGETAPFQGEKTDFYALSLFDSRWIGVKEQSYRLRISSEDRAPRNYTPDTIPTNRIWWTLDANRSQVDHYALWRGLELAFNDQNMPPVNSRFSIVQYGWPFLSHEAHGAVHGLTSPSIINGSESQQVAGALILKVSSTPTIPIFGRSPFPNTPPAAMSFTLTTIASRTYLPYAPLWRGLLYNTLFYALIFFILTSTKRAYRHARRLRKGKCPICAYDLKFDNTIGCPECGWRKA